MRDSLHKRTALQAMLRAKKLDAFLISNIKNVFYLSGFSGSSAFMLVTKDHCFFFTDFRYEEQAGKEVGQCGISIVKGKQIPFLKGIVKKLGIKKLGFETSVSYDYWEQLKAMSVALQPERGLIEEMRKRKTAEELAAIRKATERAEQAFLMLKPRIRVGAKERALALLLEQHLKKVGCRSIPFDIIVASGKNAAMPHAKPTDKKVEPGDFVIIDWGGEAGGYYSDITRTLLMAGGKDTAQKKKIYGIVHDAGMQAIHAVRRGTTTRQVDAAARDFIRKAGYGDFFGHATGHGVGINVHEAPSISQVRSERVTDGMVFTIEPGIYLPSLGGVRIEDMVEVRNGKAEVLTTLDK